MTADEQRDELAELAWGVLVAAGLRDETRGPSPSVLAHAIVENLMPVVDRIATARAAAEREALAAWMESLASPTLTNDPFIRAADWAAKLVREYPS